MALTIHELFHLNAVITECDESINLPKDKQDKLSEGKKVKKDKFDKYIKRIKKEAEDIITDDTFPVDLSPSDIHDYLEQNLEEDEKI